LPILINLNKKKPLKISTGLDILVLILLSILLKTILILKLHLGAAIPKTMDSNPLVKRAATKQSEPRKTRKKKTRSRSKKSPNSIEFSPDPITTRRHTSESLLKKKRSSQ